MANVIPQYKGKNIYHLIVRLSPKFSGKDIEETGNIVNYVLSELVGFRNDWKKIRTEKSPVSKRHKKLMKEHPVLKKLIKFPKPVESDTGMDYLEKYCELQHFEVSAYPLRWEVPLMKGKTEPFMLMDLYFLTKKKELVSELIDLLYRMGAEWVQNTYKTFQNPFTVEEQRNERRKIKRFLAPYSYARELKGACF